MHVGMTLQELVSEVSRQVDNKADYITSTKDHLAMVPMPDFENEVALVVSRPERSVLERFEVSENCHKQIAARLKIPQTYYKRLLRDHRDLLLENVNALFKREPELRMVRTLDGRARAFLSNSYKRIDNAQILTNALPVVKNDFPTQLLSSYVDEDRMRLKVLFTGDSHAVEVGRTRDGSPDILRTGFEIGNSETGKGSQYVRGFLYRDYCTNGCVWGMQETLAYKQIHLGSRLGLTPDLVLSDETHRREDALIVSATRDVLAKLASPEFTQQVGERIRTLRNTESVKDPHAAVEAVTKELRMNETEAKNVLESFIRDQDYTQWGMVNAVTQQANPRPDSDLDYNRASKIEEMGAKIIDLNFRQWNKIAQLEAVAA